MDTLVFYVFLLIPAFIGAAPVKFCSNPQIANDATVDFFELKDAHKVTWAHAVNNQTKLNQALASDTIMMLEADVQMRHNKSDTEPIMAHPPALDSDLNLSQFINKVSKTKKGMKLDFKTIMAVEPSLKLLKNASDTKSLKIPIWLNADILMGPCFDKPCTPVDATQFIDLCQKYFPSSVLSIGWTTGNDMKPVKNMYTWDNVMEMGKVVQKISQPITFPVRASLVKRSLSQLLWLIDMSRNLTLTVWSSEKDNVNVTDLVELRRLVYNMKNVYYDLPKSQAEAFAKALEGKEIFPRNPYNDRLAFGGMQGYATQSCNDVMVGETKIMFTGKGGWASTIKEVKTTSSGSNIHFNTKVSFMSLGVSDPQQSLSMVLGSKGISGANAEVKLQDGIQLILQRNGELTVIKPDGTKIESKGVSDPKFQYRLGFWYGPNMKGIMLSLTSVTDYQKDVHINYKGEFKPEKQFVLVGVGEQKGAVLVEEISAALSMPRTSSGSVITQKGIMVLALVVLAVALMATLWV